MALAVLELMFAEAVLEDLESRVTWPGLTFMERSAAVVEPDDSAM
jgi:hypothetical protein